MIIRSCRFNLISLLCLLACALMLSMGLFYYLITRKRAIIDRVYGRMENLDNLDCIFSVAVWTSGICREAFDNLERFPTFPSFPEQKYCAKSLSAVLRNGMPNPVIKRILGTFSTLEPGFYQFRVESSIPMRIYLDNGHQPSNGKSLILDSSGDTNFLTIYSKSCFLKKKFVLEIFSYCPPGNHFLHLDWLVPGSARFVPVSSRNLMPVHHVILSQNTPREVLPPEQRTLVGFIPRIHVTKGFSVCSSNYIQVWQGTNNISVYIASSPLNTFIRAVLKLIKASLQKVAPSKYPAFKINKIELTHNSTKNKPLRLLVDLNLTVDGLDYTERFSEYLYMYYHGNELKLCRPLCYQWDRKTTLTFVFLTDCSRNDSPWGLYFIQNTIELLQRSLDVNFGVILTACDEEQLRSYELRLRDSDIDRSAVVLQKAVYKRSRAMKAVLSLVEDDSIVVLCESRVKMPPEIAEEIRQHTFKSLMAYSPIPFQLDCGYFPEGAKVKGDWCPQCGGVTAMYKEDWEQMLSSHDQNTDIIKSKTELLDHIEKTGIEIIQIKFKDLYRI